MWIFLPNKNNILFVPGWNVDNGGKFGGKVIEVNYASGEVVFEARISPSSGQQALHRAEKKSVFIKLLPFQSADLFKNEKNGLK
ncbi:hypothetical protein [Algoriphagus boritolerans]|uniref:hypothetical protein n=1 Tax=Algoriphagus boritolerans TaxID=308111 RepID=UPI000B2F28C3